MQEILQVGLGENLILFSKPIQSSPTESYSSCCFEKAFWVTSCIFQNLALNRL